MPLCTSAHKGAMKDRLSLSGNASGVNWLTCTLKEITPLLLTCGKDGVKKLEFRQLYSNCRCYWNLHRWIGMEHWRKHIARSDWFQGNFHHPFLVFQYPYGQVHMDTRCPEHSLLEQKWKEGAWTFEAKVLNLFLLVFMYILPPVWTKRPKR